MSEIPTSREAALAEYSALRDEILKRMELRQKLETYVLAGAAAFYGAGYVTAYLPLTYPLVAFFLALSWAHHDYRAGQIGEYIRRYFESGEFGSPEHRCGPRWEHFLRSYYIRTPKWYDRSLTAIGAGGVFVFTQLLTMKVGVYSWSRMDPSQDAKWQMVNGVAAFCIVDAVVVLLTCWALHRRRRK